MIDDKKIEAAAEEYNEKVENELEKNPFKPRDLQRSALILMRYGCSKA